MIKCPQCNATLPPSNQLCQFCGADVSKVQRPLVQQKQVQTYQPAQWVQGAYYGISAYWVIEGVFQAATGLGILGRSKNIVEVAFGVVGALFGLGLLLRLEVVRGIVNFFCGLQIIFGVFGLAGAVMGTFFSGFLGLVLVVVQVLQIASAGLMIYVIGETETKAPNF